MALINDDPMNVVPGVPLTGTYVKVFQREIFTRNDKVSSEDPDDFNNYMRITCECWKDQAAYDAGAQSFGRVTYEEQLATDPGEADESLWNDVYTKSEALLAVKYPNNSPATE